MYFTYRSKAINFGFLTEIPVPQLFIIMILAFPAARNLLLLLTILLFQTRTIVGMTSTSKSDTPTYRIIDSHLHVWGTAQDAEESACPFPFDNAPPASLQDKGSTQALLEHMAEAGVSGALIVQPINYKYDHSYVINALQQYPHTFKGMLLHDPTLSTDDAIRRVKSLKLQGFNSVRFNPYLWPLETNMSHGAGLAVYRQCAELHMPVGIMCFHGLDLHYEDILQLIHHSPKTILIMDHFGFAGFTDRGETNFAKLQTLATYPNVYIKISALFRLNDPFPFDRVKKERFQPLLESFGKDRLMFGTDFPYVLEKVESYKSMIELVTAWMDTDEIRRAVMGGTAEKVFGTWGTGTAEDGEF